MSATEELRRLLDERGVEWESKDIDGISDFHDTRWNAYDVRWCYVEFVGNNYTKLSPSSEFHCTPDQAIAATFGRVGSEVGSEVTSEVSPHESNYTRLFGTPERAMRTIALIGNRYPCDEGCDSLGEKCKVCPFADAPSCRINRAHPEESSLLKWLKGDA